MTCHEPSNACAGGWDARIRLAFERRDNGTRLVDREHRGPLRVQKALYPEGADVCQAILLHPPSGIAGGDRLQIEARIGDRAHAQITTPGAGKWYRSAGGDAAQTIDFEVAGDGQLEWLPQETIVFDGARARMETRIRLGANSRYLGWEILCLGRRASGERFSRGALELHTRIERDGAPLWIERGRLDGDDPLIDSPAGFGGASVSGTLHATIPPGEAGAAVLSACREPAPTDGAKHAVTLLPGLLLARYLGHNSEAARHWFAALWHILRPPLLGRQAVTPRIWTT